MKLFIRGAGFLASISILASLLGVYKISTEMILMDIVFVGIWFHAEQEWRKER